MKKIIFLTISALLLISCGTTRRVASTATNHIEQYRYDIEYIKSAGDGMSMIRVWSYGLSAQALEEKCKVNAVHGVIFKGFVGPGSVQPALVKSATGYDDNKEFFDKFFHSGDYLRYVSSTIDGSVETRKTSSGEFKVSMTMVINTKMLRKHLEQAGIIRSLSAGF